MRRNDVLAALERRDLHRARAARQALADAFSDDPYLAPLATLLDALANSQHAPPEPDHAALAQQRAALAGPVAAAARLAFGDAASTAWLQPIWRSLATRCERLTFMPAHADDHAAALWLHAQEWPLAAEAVARIESWRRIPAPLGWMTEARYHLAGLDDTWPLLVELAWLAPVRLNALLARLQDPLLARLQNKFDAAFEGAGDATDLAWFPAWLLTFDPAFAPHLGRAQPSNHEPAEQAMRLLLDLLALEHQGRHHDLVPRRKSLRDLNESLFAIYLSTR